MTSIEKKVSKSDGGAKERTLKESHVFDIDPGVNLLNLIVF